MGYATMEQRLAAGSVAVLDGGTGTELQRRGVWMDPQAWCGPASLERRARACSRPSTATTSPPAAMPLATLRRRRHIVRRCGLAAGLAGLRARN